MLRLDDLGEEKIIEELILPIFPSIVGELQSADDCAILEWPDIDKLLLQTSDPCPHPVVFNLFDQDYYHYGWLSVVINASDIAAMGGHPLSMQLLIDAPKSMLVQDFKKFISGIKDAAQKCKVSVNGGNIRDNSIFSSQVSMTGIVDKRRFLVQSSAKPKQNIFAIGNSGHFWLSVLASHKNGYKKSIEDPLKYSALVKPTPKLEAGQILSARKISQCATDASDGLMSAISSIAKSSKVNINIETHELINDKWYLDTCLELGVPTFNPFFAWGDWQIVCAIDDSKLDLFYESMNSISAAYNYIGVVEGFGSGEVKYLNRGKYFDPPNLKSDKFTKNNTSYKDWVNIISGN